MRYTAIERRLLQISTLGVSTPTTGTLPITSTCITAGVTLDVDAVSDCPDCVRGRQMKGHGSKFEQKKEEAIAALLTQMLAYNLNCWLMLFNREEQAKTEDLKHITLATARLRFLFLAAKIS